MGSLKDFYHSKGYQSGWDGKFKGKLLPAGVYYYAIRTSNSDRKMTGYLTIIR